MPAISAILVDREGALFEDSFFLIPDLGLDPDTALEGIRAYFAEAWNAQVHALSWIFPEDLLLPADDREPVLVLHITNPGRLGQEGSKITKSVSPEVMRLFLEASMPSDSEPWNSPEWLPRMADWINSAFSREEVRRISQIRVCANGAVLRLETARDCYYLKTLPVACSHERQLLFLLDDQLHGICPPVLRISPDPNTHITRATPGRALRTISDPAPWKRAFRTLARFQVDSLQIVDEIKAIGLPCQSLSGVSPNLESIFAELIGAQKDARNKLDNRELDAIQSLVAKAERDVEVLAQCGIPEALVHGDLNESNIFVDPRGEVTLIDWTFSRVSHPFFTLGFSLFDTFDPAHRMHVWHKELSDAYAETWLQYACKEQLLSAVDVAQRLFWIDVAQEIRRFVDRAKKKFPGSVAQLPTVLRCALSAFAACR